MGNRVSRGALRQRVAATLNRATSVFLVLTILGTYALGPTVALAAPQPRPRVAGLSANLQPLASIADGLVTYEGVPAVLDGRGSKDLDGTIVKYEWEYDGPAGHWSAVTTVPTVTVTFPSVAWQEVKLRVTDDSGATSQDLTHVRVLKDDTLPVAALAMPASAIRGQEVLLDASASTDPHGAIVSYAWDFDGNGTNDLTTSEPTVKHAWAEVGTYTVWLTVTDGIGTKDITSAKIVIEHDIPAPPTGLAASDHPSDEGGRLDISWTASADAWTTGYRVYRSLSAEGPFETPVASLGAVTSWSDTGLENGTAYHYAVTAVGPGGESIRSAVASATPIDDIAPATPVGVTAEDVPADQGGSVSVAWTANGEADLAGYKVRCIDEAGAVVEVVDVAAGTTSHVFSGLTNGSAYRFTVAAYDAAGNTSPASAAASATPLDQLPPAAPTGLLAVDHPGDEGAAIDLTWNANTESDLMGYQVFRRALPSGAEEYAATVMAPVTTWTDSTCQPGVDYVYTLRAFDPALNLSDVSGQAVSSALDNVAPAPVGSVWASDVTPDQGGVLEAGWSPSVSPDVSVYVAKCLDAEGDLVATYEGTAQTCTFEGLTTGAEYRVVVYARDAAGNVSQASAPAVATSVDDLTPAVPGAPSVVDVVPDEGGSIVVSWPGNTESDLGGYTVYRYNAEGVLAETRDAGFATSIRFDGLALGESHSFEVRAKDRNGNLSAASARVSGTAADETAPEPVVAQAQDHPNDQGGVIDVTWSAGTSADTVGYKVYRDGALIADVTGTSYADRPYDREEHTYVVKAVDGSGNLSAGSTPVIARAIDNLAPATPTGVVAIDVADDEGGAVSVRFEGVADTDVDGYTLYCYGPDGSVVAQRDVAALDRSADFHDLVDGTTYSFRVEAFDTSGNRSDRSAAADATPADNLAPAAPTGLLAEDVPADQGGAVRVRWTASPEDDLVRYAVYRAALPLTPDLLGEGLQYMRVAYAEAAEQPEWVDVDARVGITYSYVVTALDEAANESGPSGPAQGASVDSLAPGEPVGLQVSDVGADQGGALRLTWTANTENDLAGYSVYRAEGEGALAKVADGLQACTFIDEAAVLGTTYRYAISASDASGNESEKGTAVSGASIDNVAPVVPQGLQVADVENDQGGSLRLAWLGNTETDFASYSVYRRARDTDFELIASGLAAPSFVDDEAVLGNAYQYAVTASDRSGNRSDKCAAVDGSSADNIAPAKPTGLSAADVANDEGGAVLLMWNANTESDLSGYSVYRSTSAEGEYTLVSTVDRADGSTWADTSVTDGTLYFYKVTASDVSGNPSDMSELAVAASSDNVAPLAPTGLIAVDTPNDDGGSIDLAWTAPAASDVHGYKVYRAESADGPFSEIGDVSTASFTDSGRTDGTDYFYLVKAYDGASNLSDPCPAVPGVAVDTVAPVAPTGVTAIDSPSDQGGSIRLAWLANTDGDVAGYSVTRFDILGAETRDAGNVTSFVFAGLPNGLEQRFAVSAYDTAGNVSDLSIAVLATPADNLAPEPPVGLHVNDVAGDQGGALRLTWTGNTEGDLGGYTIYRGTSSEDLFVLGTAAGEAYVDDTAALGTTYYYSVTASDIYGNQSDSSTAASGHSVDNLPPAPPSGLSVVDVPNDQGGSIRLGWDVVSAPDVAGYTVYRGTSADTLSKLEDVSEPTYLDTSATKNVTYYYEITTRDSAGNESAKTATVSCVSLDSEPPAAPTGVTASDRPDDAGGVIDVTWAASAESDVTHYMLYRASSPEGAFEQIADGSSPGLADRACTNGATYYYYVVASDASGNVSAPSGIVSASASINLDTSAPERTGAIALTPGNGMIALNWAPVHDNSAVTGYEVYMKQGVGGTWTKVANATTEAYTAASLSNGFVYYFKVRAYDGFGNFGAYSEEVYDTPEQARTMTTTTIEENNTAISYLPSGAWGPYTYPEFSAGRMMHTRTPGATATFAFSGTAVSLSAYNAQYTNRGLAEIWIDGVFQRQVDLSGPLDWRNVFYQSGQLSDGTHTITIKCLGQPGAYSTGDCIVDIDMFTVTKNGPAAPGAPSGLAVVDRPNDNGDALNLTWGIATEPDVVSYRVWRAPAAEGQFVPVADLPKVASYSDTGLTKGTRYYYQLTAIDTFGVESVRCPVVSATTVDQQPPAVPVGLVATDKPNDDTGRVVLSWAANAESDEAGYRVYRAPSASGVYARVGDVTTNGFEDSGLMNGVTYYYKVTSYDISGNESAWQSSAVLVAPQDDVAPAAPTLRVVDHPNDSGNALDLTWNQPASSDVQGYKVYRARSSEGPWTLVTTIGSKTTLSYLDSGLANAVPYYYRMTAYDAARNESADTVVVMGMPKDDIAPTAPSCFLALAGDSYACLSWAPATDTIGVDGYEVWMKVGATGIYAKVADLTAGAQSHVAVGLANGTTYYFKVRARDAAGNLSSFVTERGVTPVFAIGGAVTTRLDDRDPAINFQPQGAWANYEYPDFYLGHMMHTRSPGATASFTFTGTGVSIAAGNASYTNRGLAEVWLDGVFQRQVDLSGPLDWRNIFYDSGQLSDGTHTITIKCLGRPGAYSTGDCIVDIDFIDVTVR